MLAIERCLQINQRPKESSIIELSLGFSLQRDFLPHAVALGIHKFSVLLRGSLKFSWVVFMMSQTDSVTFVIYSLGICLHVLLFF